MPRYDTFCWTPTTPCLTLTWTSTRPWVSPWPATAFPLRRRPSRPISTSTPLFGPNSTAERSPGGRWWWSRFSSFLRAVGRAGDPAELNGITSPAWGARVTCSRGRRRCAGPWPPAGTLAIITNGVSSASGAALPQSDSGLHFSPFYFGGHWIPQGPGGSFRRRAPRYGHFRPGAPWWVATHTGSDILGAKNAGLDASGITPGPPARPICPRC